MNDQVRANLSEQAVHNVERWLTEPKYAEYAPAIQSLIDNKNWQELEDSFFQVIEFGTGGRRGKTGVGSNRINRVTIGESAQALCMYAAQTDPEAPKKGVVIACDTRLTSKELSEYTASVCAANGFKTYIFDSFRSTPELSFAVRHLKTAVGIVISASHNPPADNGFKAYWSDGGQLIAPHDKGVVEIGNDIEEIFTIPYEDAVGAGKIIVVGNEIDEAYIAAVVNQSGGSARDLDIVYSPLHGAGQRNTLPALKAAGFQSISIVKDQMNPDGNFPTVEGHKANPEEKIANDRAVAQLLAESADIAITNDPDADRVGVMVRDNDAIIYLTGNEAAVLSADYVLQTLQRKGNQMSDYYIVKTIVTTDMLNALAEKYGVELVGNLLVGFKYVARTILEREATNKIFALGAEESFGLLKGDYARDKDGAVGGLVLAEYAAELKMREKTLYDRLKELYREYGVYRERLDSAYFEGATGFSRMQAVMESLRQSVPRLIEGQAVTAVLDYKTLVKTNLADDTSSTIDCDSSNIIVLECNNDSRCRITIRPSGTEPKIKLYVQWFERASEDIASQVDILDETLIAISRDLEGILLR